MVRVLQHPGPQFFWWGQSVGVTGARKNGRPKNGRPENGRPNVRKIDFLVCLFPGLPFSTLFWWSQKTKQSSNVGHLTGYRSVRDPRSGTAPWPALASMRPCVRPVPRLEQRFPVLRRLRRWVPRQRQRISTSSPGGDPVSRERWPVYYDRQRCRVLLPDCERRHRSLFCNILSRPHHEQRRRVCPVFCVLARNDGFWINVDCITRSHHQSHGIYCTVFCYVYDTSVTSLQTKPVFRQSYQKTLLQCLVHSIHTASYFRNGAKIS